MTITWYPKLSDAPPSVPPDASCRSAGPTFRTTARMDLIVTTCLCGHDAALHSCYICLRGSSSVHADRPHSRKHSSPKESNKSHITDYWSGLQMKRHGE